MEPHKPEDIPDTFTVSEVKQMLADESANVTRAAQMRINEFQKISEGYAAGEVTAEQVVDKLIRHADKWGDAFPGVVRDPRHRSDTEIAADMEKAAGLFVTREELRKRHDKLFAKSRPLRIANLHPKNSRGWKLPFA